MENLIVKCPHCHEDVLIEQINCAIFRHGVFKENMMQIPPHLPKNICDELYKKNLIFGCGKPFQLFQINNQYEAKICDYI